MSLEKQRPGHEKRAKKEEFFPSGIVTLSSDFGLADWYVPAMKGVILSINPRLVLQDCCHFIRRHDVVQAGYLLEGYAFEYPSGTVHVVVVDPGVGSSRAALAALVNGHLFLAPDNGLLSWVLADRPFGCRIIDPSLFSRWSNTRGLLAGGVAPSPGEPAPGRSELDLIPAGRNISSTFHGRDIFAPAAAFLASGRCRFNEIGEPTTPLILPKSMVEESGNIVTSRVVHVDSFGNAITGITREHVAGRKITQVKVGEIGISRVVEYYAQEPPGTPVLIWGSRGTLEISVVEGNAAALLNLKPGDAVRCFLSVPLCPATE